METAILAFQKKLSANKGIGFFHYGGHAVQVNGENYLIPADADIPDEPRVSSRAVNVSEVMFSMQADTNIVILDSCRNNPLPSGSGRSASRGLQMVKNRPRNSVIVYSAEAGKTAQDGVFSPILTKKILENKELIAVLRDVRNEVAKATNDEQNPGQYDQLKNEVFLAANVPSRLAKVESEAYELDKQLETLRAQRANAQNIEEQNRIAMEQQRIEAEKKRKELELQQVRDAEARRAAEQKRIEEENAKKNENQRQQEQQFAKMQADNAAKLKEIERLSAATNIDDMVATANSLYQTINNITDSYTASMNKAIDETKSFYSKKKDQIIKSKYESETEFVDRRRSEEDSIEAQQNWDIAALQNKYRDEIADNTAELKRKLKALEGQTEVQTGNNIKLTFGEYNAEKRFFPAVITDTKNPDLKLGCPMIMRDYELVKKIYTDPRRFTRIPKQNTNTTSKRNKSTVEYDYVPVTETKTEKVPVDRSAFIQKCMDTENKINAGCYVGFVKYELIFDVEANKYAKYPRALGIKEISTREALIADDIIENVGTRDFMRLAKGLKYLGDDNIVAGDIFYEGEIFSSEYLSDYKAVGIVFRVDKDSIKIISLDRPEKSVNFKDALNFCKGLTTSGGGWYLPDKNELQAVYNKIGIIDKCFKQVNKRGFFPSYHSGSIDYWSSSAGKKNADQMEDRNLYNFRYSSSPFDRTRSVDMVWGIDFTNGKGAYWENGYYKLYVLAIKELKY